jgi:hypothetical protein
MLEGEVMGIRPGQRDDINVQVNRHKYSAENGKAYWVKSSYFSCMAPTPPVVIPILSYGKGYQCRYNDKTKTFSVDISGAANVDPSKNSLVKVESVKSGIQIIFKQVGPIKDAEGEVNYWQYTYNPGPSSVVKTKMDLVIFND